MIKRLFIKLIYYIKKISYIKNLKIIQNIIWKIDSSFIFYNIVIRFKNNITRCSNFDIFYI